MARRCTIPCDIGGVEARIRNRALQRTLAPHAPLIALGVALVILSPVLIAVATWQVAVVAALFFLLGIVAIVARGFLQANEFTRLGVPAELDRIIDEHEREIHAPRLVQLRAEASRLTYDSEDYRNRVTQFLEELRIATGEAWRCPCRKRRLPLPLPGV